MGMIATIWSGIRNHIMQRLLDLVRNAKPVLVKKPGMPPDMYGAYLARKRKGRKCYGKKGKKSRRARRKKA